MRKGLVVVGLTAIVVGSIGYLRLMDEALPEPAGAGTPRAVSPTGHDTAAETSPPSVPAANAAPGGLLETQRLLRRHDFEAQKAYEAYRNGVSEAAQPAVDAALPSLVGSV